MDRVAPPNRRGYFVSSPQELKSPPSASYVLIRGQAPSPLKGRSDPEAETSIYNLGKKALEGPKRNVPKRHKYSADKLIAAINKIITEPQASSDDLKIHLKAVIESIRECANDSDSNQKKHLDNINRSLYELFEIINKEEGSNLAPITFSDLNSLLDELEKLETQLNTTPPEQRRVADAAATEQPANASIPTKSENSIIAAGAASNILVWMALYYCLQRNEAAARARENGQQAVVVGQPVEFRDRVIGRGQEFQGVVPNQMGRHNPQPQSVGQPVGVREQQVVPHQIGNNNRV